MNKFRLNRRIEAFDDRVVPAVTFAAHAASHTVIFKQLLERSAGVLTTAIGMMHYTATGLPSQKRHAQCIENERFLKALTHRPTDHAARTQVEDYGEVEPSFHGIDVRDV